MGGGDGSIPDFPQNREPLNHAYCAAGLPQDCDQLCVRVHLVAMQMARLSHLSLHPEWLNIETMG